MNWSRIIKFSIVLFLATAAAAFPFGFIRGFMSSKGYSIPGWVTLSEDLAGPFVSILVFARLACLQRTEPLYNALMVGLICWLVSFPINVIFSNQPIAQWAWGVVTISITVGVGVAGEV